MLKTFKK